MFCTACSIEVTNTTHYTTQLHSVNTKRKLNNIPPLFELEEQPVEPMVLESKVYKHYSTKKTIHFDENCFYCEHKGNLLEHINNEHVKIDCKQLEVCISDYSSLTCFYCKKIFKTENCLREHLLTYFRKQNVAKVEIQVRRPYDVKEGQITKVEVKKNNKDRNIVMKNEIKVSLGMNHQKHFVAHWLQ